jgi:uncharacterized OB-fold protein
MTRKSLLTVLIFWLGICHLSAQPVITAFSPKIGPTGLAGTTTMTITGTGFNTTAANNVVRFGGVTATVNTATATQLSVTVPTGVNWEALSVLNTATNLMGYSYQMANPFMPTFTGNTVVSPTDFANRVDYSVASTNPYGVTTGDLNGDGKPDMVTTNFGGSAVYVFTNTSTTGSVSSFSAGVTVTTGGASTRHVNLTDLDGDGMLDMVVSNATGGNLSVFRNTTSTVGGTISFGAALNLSTGAQPWGVSAGDLDADGKPDLVAANSSASTVSVFRNTSSVGTISFATGSTVSVGASSPIGVVIGDLDGNGKPDVATSNGSGASITILSNTTSTAGTITFASAYQITMTGASPIRIVMGDLNNDGKQDLAVADNNTRLAIVENTYTTVGTPAFGAPVYYAANALSRGIAIGDLNGDGLPDLAVSNGNHASVSVYTNLGKTGTIDATSFTSKQDFLVGATPQSVAIADVTGDGRPEIMVASENLGGVSVLNALPSPPGIVNFTPKSGATGSSGSTTVTITGSNFNTTSANNTVRFGTAPAAILSGTATQLTVTAPAGATWGPVSVANTTTGVTGYSYGTANPFIPTFSFGGTIDFASKVDRTTGTNPQSVAIGDLDGDGKPDIVVANNGATGASANTGVSVFRNISVTGTINSGSFTSTGTLTTQNNPRSITLADFDADGKLDIAVANFSSNTVSIFQNTSSVGSISFSSITPIAVGSNPIDIATGDIDSDGRPDIVVANNAAGATNHISILRNTSVKTPSATFSFAATSNFSLSNGGSATAWGIAIGDVDLDGKPDIVVANRGTANAVTVFKNTSIVARFSFTLTSYTASSNPYGAAIADLDLDGKPEILVANNNASGTVSIFQNTNSVAGTVSFSTTAVNLVTAANPIKVAVGDVTADTYPDLIVVNTSTAANSVSIFRNKLTSSGTIALASFELKSDFTTGQAPYDVSIADMDGDGKPELVTANSSSNSVSVLFGTSRLEITNFTPGVGYTGTAGNTTVTITGTNFNPVAASNIVRFGNMIATVLSASSTVLTVTAPWGSTWGPLSVQDISTGQIAYSYKVANPFIPTFNGNDIISPSSFAKKTDFATGTAPVNAVFADLNDDGKPDLIVPSNSDPIGAVSIFENISTTGTISSSSFSSAITLIPSGSSSPNPQYVAVGDLDGDGKPDLAVANYGVARVAVIKNNAIRGASLSASSFATRVEFVTSTNPSGVAIGDLNGDGKPEIVVANLSSNSIGIFQNTSSVGVIDANSFGTQVVPFTNITNPRTVVIGDVDGDGKPDLVAAASSDPDVHILLNNTTVGAITAASFTKATVSVPSIIAYDLAMGDLNGDGKPDLALVNELQESGNPKLAILRNTSTVGSVSFESAVTFTTGSNPVSVSIGDLNGDGKPDLVTAHNYGLSIGVFRNTITNMNASFSSSSLATRVDFLTSSRPYGAVIADIDGDGKPEIAVANFAGNNVSILSASASIPVITGFTPGFGPTGTAGTTTITITGYDFNTTPANNRVRFGSTNAIVSSATSNQLVVTAPWGAIWAPLSVTDLGTGATGYSYSVANPFIPTFTGGTAALSMAYAAKADFVADVNPQSVAIGDLDGDGKPEVVVANYGAAVVSNFAANGLTVFANTSATGVISSGTLSAVANLSTRSNPRVVAMADFDGDGKLDIAVANYGNSSVSVFRNTSAGTGLFSFTSIGFFSVTSSPSGMVLGDLDSDGKTDIAVVSNNASATNQISVLRNSTTSSISFDAATNITMTNTGTPRGWGIAMGDMDMDGKPDIIVSQTGNANYVSIFRNVSVPGAVFLTGQTNFTTATTPYGIAVGDLNKDGKPDIAVVNNGSASVSVLENTNTVAGTFSFGTKVDFTAGTNPISVAIADLDGDAWPDLAVVNSSTASNTVSVFRNKLTATATIATTSFETKLDFLTGQAPYSVAVADLDGNGKPEIVVANNNVASVSVLYPYQPIEITDFTPKFAPTGTAAVSVLSSTVTISGTGFNSTTTNNIVRFGTALANVLTASSTQLTVTAPWGATWAPLSVQDVITQSKAYSYKVANPFIPTFTGNSIILPTDFAKKTDLPTSGTITSARSVAIGDIDGDGKPDIVVTNNGTTAPNPGISVFRNTSTTGTISTGSFASKVDFATGSNPYNVAIDDIDGDGKLDVAVVNYSSNTLSILRNTSTSGSVSFATKVDFTTATNPSNVSIGDLNGDGKPEIAVTNFSTGSLSVFQNTATSGTINSSSLGSRIDWTSLGNIRNIAIGDMDGDGKPEMTVMTWNTTTLEVFQNSTTVAGVISASSFTRRSIASVGISAYDLAIGDLDGDGKLDVAIVGSSGTTVGVLRNTSASAGSFTFATIATYNTATSPQYISINDMNGDGKPDLLVSNNGSASLSVLANTSTVGTINFANKVDFATGLAVYGTAAADLDGDGKPEIVVANINSNNISILSELKVPTITNFTPRSGLTGTAGLTTVSISGGNFNSVATSNLVRFGGISATVNAGTVTTLTVTAPAGATWAPLSVMDIDTRLTGFSYPIANPFIPTFAGTGSINANDYVARVDFATVTTTNYNPWNVSFADLNGDGKVDMIVTNAGTAGNSISVYRNTSSVGTISSASFATKADFTTLTSPRAIAIGDLDGDGLLDIAVPAFSSTTSISVLRNTSSGSTISFATKVDFTVGSNPISIAIGDLDGDGKPDLAVANNASATSANISLLRNTISSTGTFTAASFATKVDLAISGSSFSTWSIAMSDLDGDNKPDLAVSCSGTSNSLACYRNTSSVGVFSFATATLTTVGTTPRQIAVGDLNNDNKADVVVVNNGSNNLSLLRNSSSSGTISFVTETALSTGTGPMGATIGDLDGDGLPDVAVANNTNPGSVSAYRNTSSSSISFGTGVSFTTGTNTGPYHIAIVDIDGDGKPEMAVVNNTTQSVSILFSRKSSFLLFGIPF